MATSRLANRVMLLLAFVLASGGAAADLALGACGDGVLDAGEQCDHGAANGTDNCCFTTCQLVDHDGDGTYDAIDPCDDSNGIRITDATLRITGLLTPPGDDGLRFIGTVTIPNENTIPASPPIDPGVFGLRLRMFAPGFDPRGSAVMDASIPGGPQWARHPSGTAWTYHDPAGLIAGITRVTIKLLPPLFPSTHITKVAFSIMGRRGGYPVTPDMVTSFIPPGGQPQGNDLQVTLSVTAPGSALNAQCGSVFYTTIEPTRCEFSASGNKVTCSGPPPVGPCHVGDPKHLVVCDLLNAAHAEDRYFTEHGTYLTGPCTALPRFVASPGVTCTVRGGASAVTVSTAHADWNYSCYWTSNPAPGNANITCL